MTEPGALRFADRLTLLFAAFPQPPDAAGVRRPWSDTRVAHEAVRLTGHKLTRQYVGMLRSDKRASPSLDVARAIAIAFEFLSAQTGTPCDFERVLAFLSGTGDAAHVRADPESVRAHLAVPQFAWLARLGEMDPASQRAIQTFVNQLADVRPDDRQSWLDRLGLSKRKRRRQ